MKIALDAQLISRSATYRSAGVAGYSLALLRELGILHELGASQHSFHAFVNAPATAINGVQLLPSRLPLHLPPARIVWEQAALPLHLARGGFDLVHGLVNVLPLLSTRRDSGLISLPGVVTVHDLSFVRLPDVLPAAIRAYLTALGRRSALQAQRVIAVSRQTADDLIACFGVSSARIVVVPNGVGAEFTPAAVGDAHAFRAQKGLPERFLLYLGTLEPRKNLETLVRAYARWRAHATDDGDVALVLSGGKGWFYDTIFATVRQLGLEAHVRFPGYLPAAELPDWYRAALG
ncbi:MAG: glycosyltransferase family 4 protein, partial [Caldilineaceae bacterium]